MFHPLFGLLLKGGIMVQTIDSVRGNTPERRTYTVEEIATIQIADYMLLSILLLPALCVLERSLD